MGSEEEGAHQRSAPAPADRLCTEVCGLCTEDFSRLSSRVLRREGPQPSSRALISLQLGHTG